MAGRTIQEAAILGVCSFAIDLAVQYLWFFADFSGMTNAYAKAA